MPVRLPKSITDDDAIDKIGHDASLYFRSRTTVDSLPYTSTTLTAMRLYPRDREGLRAELKREFLRVNVGLERGLQVRRLLEVEEHLAVHEAVAVVILVQVPGRDVARVGVLVLGSAGACGRTGRRRQFTTASTGTCRSEPVPFFFVVTSMSGRASGEKSVSGWVTLRPSASVSGRIMISSTFTLPRYSSCDFTSPTLASNAQPSTWTSRMPEASASWTASLICFAVTRPESGPTEIAICSFSDSATA